MLTTFAQLMVFYTTGQEIAIDSVPANVLRKYNRQMANKDFYTRVTQFSELSWVSPPFMDWGDEKDGFILSADISPHFFIGGEKTRFVLAVNPKYRVRIFRDNLKFGDSSLPVRTPSFMPSGTIYIPIDLGKHNLYKDIRYLSISLNHHSNGQDGKTFISPGLFNFYNGNFSTNFFEIYFNVNDRRKFKTSTKFICTVDSPGHGFDTGYYDRVHRFGFEQHVGTAYSQRGTYGRTRIAYKGTLIKVDNHRTTIKDSLNHKNEFQLGKCYLLEKYRFNLNFSAILDKLENPFNRIEKRINIDLGYYKRISTGNTALFAMVGYYGNDPYNIYYPKNYFFARAGLALGFFVHTSKLVD